VGPRAWREYFISQVAIQGGICTKYFSALPRLAGHIEVGRAQQVAANKSQSLRLVSH